MIKQLGGSKIPTVLGHRYNYQWSSQTRSRIQQFYTQSRFVQHFPKILSLQPWKYVGNILERNNDHMKALGLALMYEGMKKT